jgi:hypothetical protein
MHMTSLTSPLPDVHSGLRISPLPKLVIALALTGFADWLFYDQRSGISVVLLAVVLAAAALLANLDQLTRRRAGVAGLVLLAGLAPVVEELNALSLVFVVLALAMSIALVTGRELSRTGNQLAALRDLYLIGPFRLVGDVISTLKVQSLTRGIALWFVPAVFGTIFVILFASANPLIDQWISLLHPSNAASKIDIWRTLFWLLRSRWCGPSSMSAGGAGNRSHSPRCRRPPSTTPRLPRSPTVNSWARRRSCAR